MTKMGSDDKKPREEQRQQMIAHATRWLQSQSGIPSEDVPRLAGRLVCEGVSIDELPFVLDLQRRP